MNKPKWYSGAKYDLEHTNLTIEEIARKYNRSPYTVQKLQKMHKIKRLLPPNPTGPQPLSEEKPISDAHRRIGIKLSLYRGQRTQMALAEELGLSYYRLARMELGAHDFTLSEIQKLKTALQLNYDELVAPPQKVIDKLRNRGWL